MATRPSIIHLISELGYASERDLQEVQARQVMYGGDQEINLLELELVSEEQLLLALAQQTGLPGAPAGPLSVAIEPTRTAGERNLGVVIGHHDDGQHVAYVDQNSNDEKHSAIRAEYGEGIQFLVTTRLRLEEALARAQGLLIEPRALTLLNRLGNSPLAMSHEPAASNTEPSPRAQLPQVAPFDDEAGVETAPAPMVEQVPAPALRPMSAKMSQFDDQAPSSRGETAPPPLGYDDITALAAMDVQRGSPPSAATSARHIYNRADAEEDLKGAKTRDRVVDVLLHYAAAHFVYTAVFGVLSKEARGLKATGPGANTEALRALHIPLDLPSVLRRVRDSGVAQVCRLRASGLEGGITRDLKRSSGTDVLLFPISVANRPVILLWGDNGRHRIAIEEFQELIDFGTTVSKALEHVLIERKRASRVAQPSSHLAHLAAALTEGTRQDEATDQNAPVPQLSMPPDATEASPLVRNVGRTALSLGTRSSSNSSTSPPPLDSAPPSSTPAGPPTPQTQRNSAAPAPGDPWGSTPPGELTTAESEQASMGATQNTGAPEQEVQTGHEVAEAKKRTLTRPGHGPERVDSDRPPSFPAEAPRTLRGFPEVRTPAPSPTENLEQALNRIDIKDDGVPSHTRAPLLSRRIVPLSAPPPSREPAPEVEAPAPPEFAKPVRTTPSSTPPLSTPTFATPAKRHNSTMLSRAPIPEPDADGWGSPPDPVVRRVDPIESQHAPKSKSYSDLVRDLLNGDSSVIPRLVDGGETAVGALIAEFPGPVCAPARPTTKASECGPILEALAALGTKASPFLTVRTADEDPEVRRWATFLLGEMPGKDSAKAIASRLLDDAVEVRRAALASARRSRSDVLTRRTLRAHIEQICRDPNVPIESRCSAVEALADVREHEAIPTLLVLLEGDDRALSRATRWALSVLTRQDFGSDIAAWRAFWQEHRDEDRVEWLIASLDHEQRDIRRAAGEELRAMTNGEIEYDEDHPSSARRLAQAQFREWWNETGKPSGH